MFFNSIDVNYMDFFLTVTAYNTSWYENTIIYILIVMGI